MEWQNSTKQNTVRMYNCYLKFIGKTWTRPKYTQEEKPTFIPTEQELDSLIAAATHKTATLLQLLKETGIRIGEVAKLQWQHLDTKRKIIQITPEKGSNARTLKISQKLADMINLLPRTNEKIFQTTIHGLRTTLEKLRARTAIKLSNPRLKQIHFHTFRHYAGTMEYHKTKDIIHVKMFLGHKRIENTMIYINLENALFQNDQYEFTIKTAKTIEEAAKLLEVGFEYITEIDGTKLFRKRK